jgi:hypothetical protein
MATFAFSHLGRSSYQSNEFMGSSIENIHHMPRVPVPPGLGGFPAVFMMIASTWLSRISMALSQMKRQRSLKMDYEGNQGCYRNEAAIL